MVVVVVVVVGVVRGWSVGGGGGWGSSIVRTVRVYLPRRGIQFVSRSSSTVSPPEMDYEHAARRAHEPSIWLTSTGATTQQIGRSGRRSRLGRRCSHGSVERAQGDDVVVLVPVVLVVVVVVHIK